MWLTEINSVQHQVSKRRNDVYELAKDNERKEYEQEEEEEE
jgi:hypothetical protein